jgi:hypothetical protein
MIRIAQFYARYDATLDSTLLTESGARLLSFADGRVREHFGERYNKYRIEVSAQLEVGSTRAWVRIAALAAILSEYGSIREGAVAIVNDVGMLAKLIIPQVSNIIGLDDQQPSYHRRTFGTAIRLLRLFEQVERGEISANEATARAIWLLDADESTEKMEDLQRLKERLTREVSNAERKRSDVTIQPAFIETATDPSGTPRPKSAPGRRDPAIAPLPGSNRRRRRKGVIVSKNPETGELQIFSY